MNKSIYSFTVKVERKFVEFQAFNIDWIKNGVCVCECKHSKITGNKWAVEDSALDWVVEWHFVCL